jgi:hypothetical protein
MNSLAASNWERNLEGADCNLLVPQYGCWRLMRKFGSSARIWLVLWLTLALPFGSRAAEIRSACHMACAKAAKACHSCCGDKPGCHLISSTALPFAPGTANLRNSQSDLVVSALPAAVQPIATLPHFAALFDCYRDPGPPPRDLLAHDCVLLL